jgi:hypothetical protein
MVNATETLMRFVYWEYEDQLPEWVTDEDYSAMYPMSKVGGGVRLFPYIVADDGRREYLGEQGGHAPENARQKVCRKCRYCLPNRPDWPEHCYSPHLGTDPQAGARRLTFCDVERSAELEGACGPAGRFWEGKEK